MDKRRLLDIDRAKGLGIFLVVTGHIVARSSPLGHEWWLKLSDTINLFHMHFLFFLCGIIMAYTYRPVNSYSDYKTYVLKKFKRLMGGYILFSLIIFFGKMFSGKFLFVDNPVNSVNELVIILVRPKISFSSSLWFVYALFIFYAITPLLLKVSRNKMEFLLPFALLCYFLPSTYYFALMQVCEHLFTFLLGMYVFSRYDNFCHAIDKYAYFLMGIFSAAIFLSILFPVPKLLVGLLSIPALLALVRLPYFNNTDFLKVLGENIFIIYLMNTIAIGLIKGLLFKFMSWDGINFWFFMPVLLLSGIAIPLLLKKFVIRHIPVLNSIVG